MQNNKDKNPGGGESLRTRPDWSWVPPSLLYNGYRVSFPVVKRPGRGVNHPLPSSADVKERVEVYLSSPFGPSWPAVGWTSPFASLISFRQSATCFGRSQAACVKS